MLKTVQLEQQNKTNDPKQKGKEKTYRQKIIVDVVQPEQQNITNDLKQPGKEKTYKQKIMLDTVQPEQQNKTNDLKKTRERENIQAEDNAGHSVTRVPEQNK